MCFKKPKLPEVPAEDPALKRQLERQLENERQQRSENKAMRFEEALARLGGFGRRSLISGGKGGIGFRSMFTSRSSS